MSLALDACVHLIVASESSLFESMTVELVLVSAALTHLISDVPVPDCAISCKSVLCLSMTSAVPGTLISEVLTSDCLGVVSSVVIVYGCRYASVTA